MTSFVPGFIETRKQIARAQGRRPPRIRKPSTQLVPRGIEREFRSDIITLLEQISKLVEERLIPELPRIVAEAGLRGDAERLDVIDISRIIQGITGPIRIVLDASGVRRAQELAGKYFNAVSSFSRRQTLRQLKGVLGVDAFPNEPQLISMLGSFVEENTRLISSVPGRYLDEVGELIGRRVRAGDSASTIAMDIRQKLGISKKRAALIARDQTNKLNGALTRMRQTNLGIEQYIWRTSRDERVRASHRALEGRTFSWDDPPEVGHPGQDINCRCTAEPLIDPDQDRGENPDEIRQQMAEQRETLRRQLRGRRSRSRIAR